MVIAEHRPHVMFVRVFCVQNQRFHQPHAGWRGFLKTNVDGGNRKDMKVTKMSVFHSGYNILLTDDDVDQVIDEFNDKCLICYQNLHLSQADLTWIALRRWTGCCTVLVCSSVLLHLYHIQKLHFSSLVVSNKTTGDLMCYILSVMTHLHLKQLHKNRISKFA